MFTEQDSSWMRYAIMLAKRAALSNEVPVGAVLVYQEKILGQGANCPISHSDPTAHAEIIALREGAQTLKNYRLINTTLYVTLEPCVMCVGALVHARVKRVVYGAFDPKSGAVRSACALSHHETFNHKIEWCGGLLAEECGVLLSDFFRIRRNKAAKTD